MWGIAIPNINFPISLPIIFIYNVQGDVQGDVQVNVQVNFATILNLVYDNSWYRLVCQIRNFCGSIDFISPILDSCENKYNIKISKEFLITFEIDNTILSFR